MTEEEVDKKLGELKKQNFKTEAEFQKFLKTSHYTTQDVNERVKIQILSEKIQEQLGEGAGEPSKSEIEDYYEEAKASQFTTPPTRRRPDPDRQNRERRGGGEGGPRSRTTPPTAGKRSSRNTRNPPRRTAACSRA